MIKANDLRIGNWVSVNIETEEISANMKVAEMINPYQRKIGFINYGYASNRLTASEEEVNPIPLTPEILEKCGFGCDIFTYKHIKTEHNFSLINHNNKDLLFVYATNKNKNNTEWAVNIKYLHQLQNLYFALTGEELNIQL